MTEKIRGFFLIDSKLNVIHVSDALAQDFGLALGFRATRWSVEKFLKSLGCHVTIREIAAHLHRNAQKTLHWRGRPDPEGDSLSVVLEPVPIKDKVAFVGMVVSGNADTSERMSASAGHSVLQWAMDSLREGFFVVEARSKIIVYANNAFHRKRGLRPPLAVGTPCYQAVRGLERPCAAYGRPCPLETLGPDGPIAYCPNGDGHQNGSALVHLSPLSDAGEGNYVAGLEWSGMEGVPVDPSNREGRFTEGRVSGCEPTLGGRAPSYRRLREIVEEAARAVSLSAMVQALTEALRRDLGPVDVIFIVPDAAGKGHLVVSEAHVTDSRVLQNLRNVFSEGARARPVFEAFHRAAQGAGEGAAAELNKTLGPWTGPLKVLGHGTLGTPERPSGYYLVLSAESQRPVQDVRCFLEALFALIAGPMKRLIVEEAAVEGASFQEADLSGRDGIIGRSKEMRDVYELIDLVAASDATVLITGENGTGKELVAQAIHNRSHRKKGPFIVAHCSAYSPTLLESELFGHEKGAFTGAIRRKMGRIERAQGGTLFLDEIGDIAPATQVLLLRFLQDHRFERVGGEATLQADVRVLAATNRNLLDEVENGRFRDDLYYRLNVISIHLPPLRDRKEDIPLLCHYFLKKYSAKEGKPITSFSSGALQALMDYDWPGNVRQLENAVSHAVILAQEEIIRRQHLPRFLFQAHDPAPAASLSENEKRLILQVLRQTQWNKHEAARKLQVSRSTLYSKIQRYGLHPESGV
ncbi:MAG: sigma-54 dependent transcriptional regulator [Desulfosoma sp.]